VSRLVGSLSLRVGDKCLPARQAAVRLVILGPKNANAALWQQRVMPMKLSTDLSSYAPLLRGSLFPLLVTVLLVLLSQYHFLPFHVAAEFLSIGVAWAMLAVMWNSYEYARNHLLMFLSIGFFWLAGIDLVHTLTYKGMGVFIGYDANLPTQLWIAARFLEALLLLIAPAFIRSAFPRLALFVGMGALAALVVAAALARLLPDAFVEGEGLTDFKIYTEYFIVFLLGVAALRFRSRRAELDPGLLQAILLVLLFTAISELAFTFYVSVYDLSNLIGHVFKIFAFWVLYIAVINHPLKQIFTAVREQKSIAERLRVSEEALRESNQFLTLALNSQLDTFFVFEPATGKAVRWNKAFRDVTGYSDKEIEALTAPDSYFSPDGIRRFRSAMSAAESHGDFNIELTLIGKRGQAIPTEYRAAFITDETGTARYLIAVGRDVTDRKQAQDRQHEQLEELRRWQSVMVDQEERMITLKSEVNALLARLGEPPRYSGPGDSNSATT